jgi:hypothetical protein
MAQQIRIEPVAIITRCTSVLVGGPHSTHAPHSVRIQVNRCAPAGSRSIATRYVVNLHRERLEAHEVLRQPQLPVRALATDTTRLLVLYLSDAQ